jgi:lipid-binding SYLF domain-containing protein
MKIFGTIALCLLVLASANVAVAQESVKKVDNRAAKRAAIDQMARETLERLLSEDQAASSAADSAVGYAVFDSFKAAVLVSGGGGVGVAVDSSTGTRTYMKMGSAGIGLGIGGQSYQVVFLFETQAALDRFIQKGWQADVNASAAAGTKGANEAVSFNNGVAIFQLTYKGLMAQADITGTKYWKHKKLNR